jgi:hypothetical protein
MKNLKKYIVLKDWQTTLIGLAIIAFTTFAFLSDKISWEQAVIGWHTGFGFIMAKDMMDDDDKKESNRISSNSNNSENQIKGE